MQDNKDGAIVVQEFVAAAAGLLENLQNLSEGSKKSNLPVEVKEEKNSFYEYYKIICGSYSVKFSGLNKKIEIINPDMSYTIDINVWGKPSLEKITKVCPSIYSGIEQHYKKTLAPYEKAHRL